ncbi:hypothetical protein [Marinimicrobium locisalis]|uniref:hypothetical protein n=1 Tax=Marinimicrobium locisalis TaxID=546022 RepID=UPI00322194F7
MKSSLIIGVFFTVLSAVGSVSAAQWTDKVSVSSMTGSRVDAEQSISISGTCVQSQLAFISPSRSNHKEMVSLLLAAMMADKEVKLYCDDSCASGNRCNVLKVKIFK